MRHERELACRKLGNAVWTHQAVAKIVARMEAATGGVTDTPVGVPHSGQTPDVFPVRL